MTEPQPEQQITVPVSWAGVEKLPVLAVNTFLGQVGGVAPGRGPDEVILSLGHVSPPAIIGTPEQQRAATAGIKGVDVSAIGRFSMSRRILGELIQVLTTTAANYDTLSQQQVRREDD